MSRLKDTTFIYDLFLFRDLVKVIDDQSTEFETAFKRYLEYRLFTMAGYNVIRKLIFTTDILKHYRAIAETIPDDLVYREFDVRAIPIDLRHLECEIHIVEDSMMIIYRRDP